MRNLGLLFSILSFTLLVFGTVLSFWIQDPLLSKATILLYGILLTFSCFVIGHSLPSPEQKAECKRNRESEIDLIYRSMDNNIQLVNQDIEHRFRYTNEDINEIYNRLTALEDKKKTK